MFSLRMMPITRHAQPCRNGFATRLRRAAALSAVMLGAWTLSAGFSMAAPPAPCALVCPFDATLDAKKCKCVKSPNATPFIPCGLVCAPDWQLDAQQCKCIKK